MITSRPTTLGELVARGVGVRVEGDPETVVRGVHHDSREVLPNDLFVSIPGMSDHGARFLDDALARGAVAVAAEEMVQPELPTLIVESARRALGAAADLVYGEPTSRLVTVGITGTNGKTTTGHLAEDVIRAAGHTPAFLGTTAFRAPGTSRQVGFTTPEGDAIARLASEALERGADHLVMEVSSHGLSLHRADSVRFAVAAFSNLTQDHLDFHAGMRDYGEAKARLFTELDVGARVINVDDDFGRRLADRVRSPVRVSRKERADVWVERARTGRDGISALVHTPKGEFELWSPLLGEHNLENLLLATAIGVALDVPLEAIRGALASSPGAPGRLERVDNDRGVAVLVDYAHTPDALGRALAALRPVTPGRLFAVFGCGGDRDRAKRPQMGRAAAVGADLVIVTSDNPRSESPAAIVAEIVPGVRSHLEECASEAQLAGAPSGYWVEVDRRRAIAAALQAAAPGDTVLIAGKGHEDYQIIGTEKRPFDDRVEARGVLERLGGRS